MPTNRRHYKVTQTDVITAHEAALFHGGLDGVRDWTLILSAIGRPYSGYHRSVAEKAAALLESLASNHGFIDGNKRTALLVLILFLDRSGYVISPLPQVDINAELEELVLKVVAHQISFPDLTAWFRERLRRAYPVDADTH